MTVAFTEKCFYISLCGARTLMCGKKHGCRMVQIRKIVSEMKTPNSSF